jgi:hypothetical protein
MGVLHTSLSSVCVSVYVSLLSLQGNGSIKHILPFGARQWFGKHIPVAKNTRYNRRIIGSVIFYAVRVLSKEITWVCLCIPLSLPGNNSVKKFIRQKRIAGGVVFYIVRVVSKESRRLILPRSSCFKMTLLFQIAYTTSMEKNSVRHFGFCFA